jgi:hypothetical protein
MRRTAIGFACLCFGVVLLPHPAMAGGTKLTPLQTEATSSNLVSTNWAANTAALNDPLVFNQFNPALGKLTGIDLTLTSNIRNDYILTFVNTPITTTIYLATSATSNPSVLSNPAERAMLTDGPTVTLFGPNGTTEIFGPPATRQPVDLVQLTETSGTWSSMLPITNPNFIPPTVTSQTLSLTLNSALDPSLFSSFIGTGHVDLPITATAFSSFYSSSGNGGGAVLTTANGVVTVQYVYSPAAVPEPSSAILLALGIGATFAAYRYRKVRRPA